MNEVVQLIDPEAEGTWVALTSDSNIRFGIPAALAVILGRDGASLDFTKPEHSFECTVSRGEPNMIEMMLGKETETAVVDFVKIEKPADYPDDDDLYVGLARLDNGEVGFTFAGSDGFSSFSVEGDNVISVLPVPQENLNDIFELLAAQFPA